MGGWVGGYIEIGIMKTLILLFTAALAMEVNAQPPIPKVVMLDELVTNSPAANSPPPAALVSATVAQNSQRALLVYSTQWWTNNNYTNIQGKVGPAIVPLNYFTVITNVSIAGLSAYIAVATNPAGPFTMAFVAPYSGLLSQINFTDTNAAPKKFYRAGYFYADPVP